MFRMIVLIVAIFTFLMLVIATYLVYRKVKKSMSSAWDKSVDVATEQQQRWKHREHLKTLPEFIQKAHLQVTQIEQDTEHLTPEWQAQLMPLNCDIQNILSTTADDLSRAEKARRFYNTSLPAYASFLAKLRTDHGQLDALEVQKAEENVAIFKEDFQGYEDSVQQARRFDFDVLMDVIKVRLKNR